MDSTEDLSARVLLKHILTTEVPRTPITRSASKEQGSSVTRRSSRLGNKDGGPSMSAPRTPQEVLRRSLKHKIRESITRKSLPATKRRTASIVQRKMNTPAPNSMLLDDADTPRHILRNILQTEPVKSPVVHERTASEEQHTSTVDHNVTSKRPSMELTLTLPDLTMAHAVSTAKGLSRKRRRHSLNVTAFEKRLREANDGEEEKEASTDDLSSLSLSSSSTSLSLKTPYVAGTEKRGLQRRVSNRRKITEEEFGAAVNQRQMEGGSSFALAEPNDTAFSLGMSGVGEPDITTDIVHSSTTLYAQPDPNLTSDLSASHIHRQTEENKDKSTCAFPPEAAGSPGSSDMFEHNMEEGRNEQKREKSAYAFPTEEIMEVPETQSQEGLTPLTEDSDPEGSPNEEVTSPDEGQRDDNEAVTETEQEKDTAESLSAKDGGTDEEEEDVLESQTEDEDAVAPQTEGEVNEEEVGADSQTDAEMAADSQTEGEEDAPPSQTEEEGAVNSQTEDSDGPQSDEEEEELAVDSQEEEHVQDALNEEEEEEEEEEESAPSQSQEVEGDVEEEPDEEEDLAVESQEEENGQDALTEEEEEEEEEGVEHQSQEAEADVVEEPNDEEEPDEEEDLAVDSQEEENEDALTEEEEEGVEHQSQEAEADVVEEQNDEEDDLALDSQEEENMQEFVEEPDAEEASEEPELDMEHVSRRARQSEGGQVQSIAEGRSKNLSALDSQDGQDTESHESGPTQTRTAAGVEDSGQSEDDLPEDPPEPPGEEPEPQSEEEDEEEDDDEYEEMPSKTPAFVRQKRPFLQPDHLASPSVLREMQPSTSGAKPAVKPKAVRKKRAGPSTREAGLPKSYLMNTFKHFAKTTVSADVYPVLKDTMDKFFDRMAGDLETYAMHAGRKTIEVEDCELLLRRQGHVNDKVPVEVLIEKYLRLDQRKLLIPIATSGNVVVPKRKRK